MHELADAWAADGFLVSVPDIFWRQIPGPTADINVALDRFGRFDPVQGMRNIEVRDLCARSGTSPSLATSSGSAVRSEDSGLRQAGGERTNSGSPVFPCPAVPSATYSRVPSPKPPRTTITCWHSGPSRPSSSPPPSPAPPSPPAPSSSAARPPGVRPAFFPMSAMRSTPHAPAAPRRQPRRMRSAGSRSSAASSISSARRASRRRAGKRSPASSAPPRAVGRDSPSAGRKAGARVPS